MSAEPDPLTALRRLQSDMRAALNEPESLSWSVRIQAERLGLIIDHLAAAPATPATCEEMRALLREIQDYGVPRFNAQIRKLLGKAGAP